MESLPCAHDDSPVGSLPGATHDRKWSRDANRARVAHHEHAQGGERCALEIDVPSQEVAAAKPTHKGQGGRDQDQRRVDLQDAVHEMENPGLERPRVLDVPDHLLQEALFADSSDSDQQCPDCVDRATDHIIAFGLFDWQRLARNQRLVDRGVAAHHLAIDWYAFAGTNADHVTHSHVVDIYLQFLTVADDAGGVRLEVEQALDRLRAPRLDEQRQLLGKEVVVDDEY